ncbi:type IV pilus twitching motility protein PilT [Pseudogracilibacillus auburnensis]|uniref:type IV pilus twitching motility protein PilT n=1 Tax=Pseudogracilibacillus auburnensis TaxID=1494959 RepID=UPI001A9606F4|nr:type IV pilus twitching motility protein PilT [Pseudogracilibacillus auburnensis]MBO1005594.1 type IV pilus twitching motility protein PilT [Pseudogracilibacillus auburnensis]
MAKVIHNLLKSAFAKGASDLHITVGVPPVLRINGTLHQYGKNIITESDTTHMANKLIPEKLWPVFEQNGDLDFSYELKDVSRYRINAFYRRNCISLAIRVVPTYIPSFDELNLPSIMEDIANINHGLVLVTGPTGSGKSTTLASIIDYMNQTMRKHIVTLEDPIEYVHEHHFCIIDQREVGSDTTSFSNGLRSALRQDPDVILVGEMRDFETIQTAITAAETGHLVLGTLHTSGAVSTINRILSVFPGNQQHQINAQLSSVLKAVISQRLFPSLDLNGRKAAHEILINVPATANLIRSNKIHQIPNVIQTSRLDGMQLFEHSINELVDSGQIARESAQNFLEMERI